MIYQRLVPEHVEVQLIREAKREQILEDNLCPVMLFCNVDLEFTTHPPH
jgi:hypothetical protein